MDLILFITYSFGLFLSIFGYGFLYRKIIINNVEKKNIAVDGFLGLFLIYLIGSVTHIFLSHGFLHNIFLHGVGLLLFFFFSYKKYFKKEEFFLFLLVFLLLLSFFIISKTNEDFPYYHLPSSLQFVQQKLQFGLGNLNHGFKQFSSIFIINSTFYLPKIEIYLFNFVGFAVQILFFVFMGIEIFMKKNELIIKNFLILTVLVFLSKFTRLSESGTDLPGQLIVTISFIYMLKFIFNSLNEDKNQKYYLSLIITLIAFSFSTKSMYLIYSLIPLFVFYKVKFKKIFLFYFIKSKNFLIIIFSIFILFLFNFSSTGCLIYPIKFSCFQSFAEWGLSNETLIYMNNHYESWAKSLSGPNYSLEDKNELINSFLWIKFWIQNYFFTKVTDFIFLILFISLIYFLSIKSFIESKKISKLKIKNFYEIYFLILLIFLIWFSKFPALRYAGYLIVYLVIIFPIIFFLSKNKYINNYNLISRFKILLFIVLIIFNTKNINRIFNEISIPADKNHTFNNFPYYWVKNVNYQKKEINNHEIYIVEKGNMCWATPSTCIRNLNFNVKKSNGYKFYLLND